MKLKFFVWIFIFLNPCLTSAQDTIYQKTTNTFVAVVVTKGHHLLFMLNYKGITYDSIMRYDYGAYYKARIKDIEIANDHYYVFYESVDWFGFVVFKLDSDQWTHVMGGPLRYLARSSAKVEAKIEEGGIIKLYETEQGETQAKTTTYLLDFVNKVISKQSDK